MNLMLNAVKAMQTEDVISAFIIVLFVSVVSVVSAVSVVQHS